MFDADVEVGEIDGLNPIGAAAAGELGLVVARQDDFGVEALEGELLGHGRAERVAHLGGERRLDGEGEAVAAGEVAVEMDFAVLHFGGQIGGAGVEDHAVC